MLTVHHSSTGIFSLVGTDLKTFLKTLLSNSKYEEGKPINGNIEISKSSSENMDPAENKEG